MSDGLRVLIVDDGVASAALVKERLAQGGIACTYLQVASEPDFRAALRGFAPQLILSELVSSGLDGLAALEIARRELPEVPFIFLSGTRGEERAIEAMRHGAADYVLKANAARLVPAVLGALRRVGERERLRALEREAREREQYYDPLTGLAKRGLFCERLDKLLRNRVGPERPPAVVAFDIMNLSNVNGSFGRHVGDLLLQQIAERLKDHSGDDERLGYLGGGTFVMLPSQLELSADNVTTLLDNTVFRDVFHIEGRAIRTSFKSGLAHYPVDGEDASTLTQRAEAALKQAKESGEQYLHYQLQMHSDIAERLALEHKLGIALDEQQFLLYYQPQVSVATGRIEGVEALLRWYDPGQGLMHPALFLPVLESSGMIVRVGDWVLRAAVQDCRRWHEMGLGPVRVAVNVAVQQVRRRTFVDTVLEAAAQCNAGGFGLDLEITETGLLHDMESASRKLRELRAAGVRIAIDDFGTGYSSLGLLSKLPVDIIKIDRSFISGLPADRASATLVSSIIGLASAFNLTVVAEGVETSGQLEQLRRLKCRYSQGYLHSRPVPAAEIERMLEAQKMRSARSTQAGKVSR